MADYGDLWDIVRAYLGKSEAALPDDDALLVAVTNAQIPLELAQGQLACMTDPAGSTDYTKLKTDAKPIFDRGAAIVLADILRPLLIVNSSGGGGALIEEKSDDFTKRYSTDTSASLLGDAPMGQVSDAARKQAWAQYRLYACVAAAMATQADSYPSSFALAGRRRSIMARCGRRGGERGLY